MLYRVQDIIGNSERTGIGSFRNAVFSETARIESKILTGKETEAENSGTILISLKNFDDSIAPDPGCLRGFTEGYLRMDTTPSEEEALALIESYLLKAGELQQRK